MEDGGRIVNTKVATSVYIKAKRHLEALGISLQSVTAQLMIEIANESDLARQLIDNSKEGALLEKIESARFDVTKMTTADRDSIYEMLERERA